MFNFFEVWNVKQFFYKLLQISQFYLAMPYFLSLVIKISTIVLQNACSWMCSSQNKQYNCSHFILYLMFLEIAQTFLHLSFCVIGCFPTKMFQGNKESFTYFPKHRNFQKVVGHKAVIYWKTFNSLERTLKGQYISLRDVLTIQQN